MLSVSLILAPQALRCLPWHTTVTNRTQCSVFLHPEVSSPPHSVAGLVICLTAECDGTTSLVSWSLGHGVVRSQGGGPASMGGPVRPAAALCLADLGSHIASQPAVSRTGMSLIADGVALFNCMNFFFFSFLVAPETGMCSVTDGSLRGREVCHCAFMTIGHCAKCPS